MHLAVDITPQTKLKGVRSDDCDAHFRGTVQTTHRLGKLVFRKSMTHAAKWRRALYSSKKYSTGHSSSEVEVHQTVVASVGNFLL